MHPVTFELYLLLTPEGTNVPLKSDYFQNDALRCNLGHMCLLTFQHVVLSQGGPNTALSVVPMKSHNHIENNASKWDTNKVLLMTPQTPYH